VEAQALAGQVTVSILAGLVVTDSHRTSLEPTCITQVVVVQACTGRVGCMLVAVRVVADLQVGTIHQIMQTVRYQLVLEQTQALVEQADRTPKVKVVAVLE
jgi:hypothetical protein